MKEIHVNLNEDMIKKLNNLAKQRGSTRSSMMREILFNFLKEEEENDQMSLTLEEQELLKSYSKEFIESIIKGEIKK